MVTSKKQIFLPQLPIDIHVDSCNEGTWTRISKGVVDLGTIQHKMCLVFNYHIKI